VRASANKKPLLADAKAQDVASREGTPSHKHTLASAGH
jgi:hypothetical protein